MTRVVWKQDIGEDFIQTFRWPTGARIVHAEIQNGRPRVWFLCDPAAPPEERHFRLVPTGGPISDDRLSHVASFLLFGGEIVAHLFEVARRPDQRPGKVRAEVAADG